MVVGHEQVFHRLGLPARFLDAVGQLLLGQHAVVHQAIVFGGFAAQQPAGAVQKLCTLGALANGGGQCFAQLGNAFNFQLAKWSVAFIVDDLQHAVQSAIGLVAVQNGHHQHLLGAVA